MKNPITFNKDFRFNEVIFENRNKAYGAYAIRNEEGSVLIKSLFAGVAFFAAIAVSPLIINSFQTPVTVKAPIGPYILKPVDQYTPDVPQNIPAPPVKIIEKTVKLDLPTPVRDAVKQVPAPTVTETSEARIGLENTAGETPVSDHIPVAPPTVNTAPATVLPKAVNNNPVTAVDVEAAFIGGINSFRAKVVNNFDAGAFEGSGGLMKTTVTFIVEKDGSISSVKAVGQDGKFNTEAEKTIKAIKGKWVPAKLNGEFVRSYFKLPIAMQFE
ncbi:energy transducer TonB [Kaistella palustris]|uniref:hypothetical protein n=1 Tax=Kaistella palustris TaxID=493376 RepID=UPI0004135864|nr:hypothetical protein [Kaistella palustris]